MAKVPGNLQRIVNGKRRYAITPRIPGGFVQPDMLIRFAEVAKKFNAVLKITGGQRIMITNLRSEDLEEAWAMMGMEPAYTTSNVVRSVKFCPGITFCKRAKQDAIRLGIQLDRKYVSKVMPSKIKMGVSGCPNSCSEVITKDVGAIGTENGWEIYAGGSAGANPRFANFIVAVSTEKEALEVIDRIMAYYEANAHIERIGAFIDHIGLEAFRKAVLEDFTGSTTGTEPAPMTEAVAATTTTTHTNMPERKQAHFDLKKGDPITKDSIIRNIIEVYPETIPALQAMGMGCLGCPSATAEPLSQAAEIHGVIIDELVAELEAIRNKS